MRWILIAVLSICSRLSAEPKEFADYAPRLLADYRPDDSRFFPVDRLRFEELVSFAEGRASYPEFLVFLNERRPQLFENYVLLHESGSLQYADLKGPRVLLFGDGMILSFAEDPKRSDRKVEIMALDPSTLRFRLAELVFPKDAEQARFEENPSSCQSCHGQPSKPLWEPYDFWPNAFGSNIGRFATRAEQDAYRLLSKAPASGIYAYLDWYPIPPTSNRSLPGIEAFTQYITQLQIMSLWQRWSSELVNFSAYIPAMLASLQGCASASDEAERIQLLKPYLSKDLQAALQKEWSTWHSQVQTARAQMKNSQIQRYRRIFPVAQNPYIFAPQPERFADETPSMAQFLWLLQKAGGDPAQLSLSQGQNLYFISVPSNIDRDLMVNFARISRDLFERLQPSIEAASGYEYSWVNFSCQELAAESRRRLSRLSAAPRPSSLVRASTVLGECMSCHGQALGDTPAIPFDRTEALRSYLQEADGKNYQEILRRISAPAPAQMPPYRRLSPTEQSSLKAVLDSLR